MHQRDMVKAVLSDYRILILAAQVKPFKDENVIFDRIEWYRPQIEKRAEWKPTTNMIEYMGSIILERIGPVAYRLRLPEELSSVHDTFHVSNLKKCLADANLHVPLDEIKIQSRRIFLIGFPAQSVRSSNEIALDSPYLLVLSSGTSQSRQHESRKPPTAKLFDVDSRRISIVTVNTKEYHSDVLAINTRIMHRTLDNSL
ncbi:hypothetical protein Tco_0524466 [Tanacetum coccineum]